MPMTMRTTTTIESAAATHGVALLRGARAMPCVDASAVDLAGAATHGVALPPNVWMAAGFSRSTPCVDVAFPMNPAGAATHGVALLR